MQAKSFLRQSEALLMMEQGSGVKLGKRESKCSIPRVQMTTAASLNGLHRCLIASAIVAREVWSIDV